MKKIVLTLSAICMFISSGIHYKLNGMDLGRNIVRTNSVKRQETMNTNKSLNNSKSKRNINVIFKRSNSKLWSVSLNRNIQIYIEMLCSKYKINPRLAFAVVETESHGDPNVVSPSGDVGLWQINFVNRGWLEEKFHIKNWFNPYQNSIGGVYMLSQLVHKYKNVNMALMAYHEGQSGMENTISQGIWETDYTETVYSNMNNIKLIS